MMANSNKNIAELSNLRIIKEIGEFIKKNRLAQNTTQNQLAKDAGLNRYTISQIENGHPISLISLIQVLRALDCLHVLSSFEVKEIISPLDYAKLKKKERQRASGRDDILNEEESLGW